MEHALDKGLQPVIAGRNPSTIESMARFYGLEWKTAQVDDSEQLRDLTATATILLNAAGPFALTSAPIIDACIDTRTHYLDIAGEAAVIQAASEWDKDARRRGTMIMPGVGFEVVASDCLAAYVAEQLPDAVSLKIGFDKSFPTSLGSIKNTIEMSGKGALLRRDGWILSVPSGPQISYFDYGHGPQPSVSCSFGDVCTAFFSTGIPNVETYMRATLPVLGLVVADQFWGWLTASPAMQSFLKSQADMFGRNPTPDERADGWGVLVAEARDANGKCVSARMNTGDVYTFTAQSAVGVAEMCLAGNLRPGFHTPSQLYGPDFAMLFEGTFREDL